REGVAVLIDLLPLLSAEVCGQAEDALYQLAGDTAPSVPAGAAADDNKKRRDAWAAWWKVNANRVDPARMSAHSWLGYTLICDNRANRVYEIDRHGKQRWSINNVSSPLDAVVLPGNRVLVAERGRGHVTERDFQGKIVWQKQAAGAVNVQRLPNGHTFIASFAGAIAEVDRNGKEIYTIPKVPGNVLAAYRSRRGEIVCVTNDNQCRFLDTTGKQLRIFPVKYPLGSMGCLDVRRDGRVLIAAFRAGKVMEYDSQGKLLHEWDVPQVLTATGLPNGHILASRQNRNRVVIELDRAGKVVREQTINQAYRARRR
ncbi:MAG: hypothetical protein ACRELF_20405, partial [Gemmataceae bacterium]